MERDKEDTDTGSGEESDETELLSCSGRGCPRTFSTKSGRYKHTKKCKFPIPQSTKTTKAKNYEKIGDRWQCKLCPSKFTKAQNFYKHYKLYHVEKKSFAVKERKTYSCVVCSKTFPKLSLLTRHQVTHTKESYFCGGCGKEYQRFDHFDSHQKKCNGEHEYTMSSICINQSSVSVSQDQGCSSWEIPSLVADTDDDDEFMDFSYELVVLNDNNDDVSSSVLLEGNESYVAGPSSVLQNDVPGSSSALRNDVPEVDYVLDVVDVAEYQEKSSTPDSQNKNCYRKSRSLASALETIQRMKSVDQAKVLRKAMDVSNTSIETILTADVDNINEGKLLDGLIKHLKGFKLYSRDSSDTFCSLLWGMCGESLLDSDFLKWLAKKIDKRPERLHKLISSWLSVTTEPIESRGRKGQSLDTKQKILDGWHEHSMVTVDRRDGRDQVTMVEDSYKKKFGSLCVPTDIKIESVISKRNQRLVKTTRHIATKTIREMKEFMLKKYEINVSLGSLINLRPFYIQTATEREKECCLCKVCLNTRLKFNALLKNLKEGIDVTHSLSEYFGHGIVCPKGSNGYYDEHCITGTCGNPECSPTSTKYTDNDFDIPKVVDYNQFVLEEYEYTNRKFEKKKGKRTVRKQFSETFVDFKASFDKCGVSYMHHRFEIKNDGHHWPAILRNSKLGYVLHMDYSENISCTPKFEPQDAHFSGKQTSLHCTVVTKPFLPEKEPYYAYHLSDSKIHDSTFTMAVTRDLLDKFPDYGEYPVLRIKSDNASTQYCCLYVFEEYSKLAKELQLPIILYYGVNGHGRGLVDAMSGFGVKTPLRKQIIIKDFYFERAVKLEEMLKKEFEDDERKIYETIEESVLNEKRKVRGDGLPIPGCRKARMISFDIDGSFQIKSLLCSCESCSLGKFDKCKMGDDLTVTLDPNFEKETEELDETEAIPQIGEAYAFTEEGSYVGLYSSTHFELFYIFFVTKKTVATEAKADLFGHTVQEGEHYVEGNYLEKVKETRTKVFYKKLSKKVYIHEEEIFMPAIPINEAELSLDKSEYIYLADCV